MKDAIKCTCFSHALNMSVMRGFKIQSVKNTVGIMTEIINFLTHKPKKDYILKNILISSLHYVKQNG